MVGTPDARVEWLVNFSEMQLPSFRGGWGAIREALATFCAPAEQPVGRGAVVGYALTEGPVPETQIRALQADVQRLLAGLVDTSASSRSDGALPLAKVTLAAAPPHPLSRRSMLLVTAPTWRATALGVAAVLLSRDAVPPLQRCPNPDCHEGPNGTRRLFAPRGKQKFCSPRCATRVYMRGWRDKKVTVKTSRMKRKRRGETR